LKQTGIGAFFDVNRLSLLAARASLEDDDYIATVRTIVGRERDAWHDLFRAQGVRFADARGNFVFFDAGQSHNDVAAMLAEEGIEIGRSHPPFDSWIRISIGLPEHNRIARRAVESLLRR
jgi:histidinol-phosphate aminotransferase